MIIHSEGGLSHYGFAVGNRAGGTLSYSKVENLGVATNNGVWTYRFEQEVAESAEPQYATLLTRNRYELILNSLEGSRFKSYPFFASPAALEPS